MMLFEQIDLSIRGHYAPDMRNHTGSDVAWRAVKLSRRERLVLHTLAEMGESVREDELQRLFLEKTPQIPADLRFEFVRACRAPISFSLRQELRRLVRKGLVVACGEELALAATDPRVGSAGPKGAQIEVASVDHAQDGCAVASDLGGPDGRAYPLRESYQGGLTSGATPATRAVATEPHVPLFTIGYEGKTLDRYLNELHAADVTLLCDVRRNPISRKPGFSKRSLSEACHAVGIAYEHLPGLGIASSQRRGLSTQADYDALFASYRRTDLSQHTEELDRISRWLVPGGSRVALTCFELLPQQCHRHCVSEALQHRVCPPIRVVHL